MGTYSENLKNSIPASIGVDVGNNFWAAIGSLNDEIDRMGENVRIIMGAVQQLDSERGFEAKVGDVKSSSSESTSLAEPTGVLHELHKIFNRFMALNDSLTASGHKLQNVIG